MDRQADGHVRQTGRVQKTKIQKDRETERQIDIKTDRHKDKQTNNKRTIQKTDKLDNMKGQRDRERGQHEAQIERDNLPFKIFTVFLSLQLSQKVMEKNVKKGYTFFKRIMSSYFKTL